METTDAMVDHDRDRAVDALATVAMAECKRIGALTPLLLPIGLVDRLEALAHQRGCSSAVVTEELLLQALEQAEALPAARCSTRLGRCSVGPVPLPFQQR
jgi:predicted DNA-binding protein